jgi:hypothetical protein
MISLDANLQLTHKHCRQIHAKESGGVLWAALKKPAFPDWKHKQNTGSLAHVSAMLGNSVANQGQLRMSCARWPAALSVEARRGRLWGLTVDAVERMARDWVMRDDEENGTHRFD